MRFLHYLDVTIDTVPTTSITSFFLHSEKQIHFHVHGFMYNFNVPLCADEFVKRCLKSILEQKKNVFFSIFSLRDVAFSKESC